MLDEAKWDLRGELERLIAEGEAVGRECEAAGRRLTNREALPPPDLAERLTRLGLDWQGLLAAAAEVASGAASPGPETSLSDAIALVERAITALQQRAARDALRGVVLGRLSRVARLEARDGPDLPTLANLRAEALDLIRLVRDAADPGALEDFTALADGTHRICLLLALVDPSEKPGADCMDLVINCGGLIDREVVRAAANGRLVVAPGGEADAPRSGPEPVGNPPESLCSEVPSPVPPPEPLTGQAMRLDESAPAGPDRPVRRDGVGSGSKRAGARTSQLETLIGPRSRLPWGVSPREDTLGMSITRQPDSPPAGACPPLGNAIDPNPGAVGPLPSESAPAHGDGKPPAADAAPAAPADFVTPPDPVVGGAVESDPSPHGALIADSPAIFTSDGVATAAADDQRSNIADSGEILARCREGDYLGASLLAAGRAFAGLSEDDPGPEALLVAHHVARGSTVASWPDWCRDPDNALAACELTPEATRLVLLAGLNLVSRAGGADPIPQPAKEVMLSAFNDLPELRTWLDAVVEALGVPGLWEQVRALGTMVALDEYKQAREAFLKRYEDGIQHRNVNAAYIHRQDNFMSRQEASRLLHDHLKTDGPAALTTEQRRSIQSLLSTTPGAVTTAWQRSTVRPTTGGVQLRGSQRADLERRAAIYLDLMNRAWRTAEALQRAGSPAGEVERLRGVLQTNLPVARETSRATPWGHLFEALAEGLVS